MSFLPDCREMSRRMSDARDGGALGLGGRLHLLICDVCRRLLAQFAVLSAAAGRAPNGGPSLSDDAKERLRRALRG